MKQIIRGTRQHVDQRPPDQGGMVSVIWKPHFDARDQQVARLSRESRTT